MLNDEQSIVGRCVHTVDSLHWREFIYCAHVLAAESDRLEYLICEEDQFGSVMCGRPRFCKS